MIATFAPAPHCGDEIVFADNPAMIDDEVLEEIEHLGLDWQQILTAAQFSSPGVEQVVLERVNHWIVLFGPLATVTLIGSQEPRVSRDKTEGRQSIA